MKIPLILDEIAAVFSENGKSVYLVGGAVRDMVRGKPAADWDLATDASPQEVSVMFRSRGAAVIPTGLKHGTVTLRWKGHSIETTTFRTETAYTDGRRPDSVSFAASIEDDLARRDFTMNALALALNGPRRGKVIDICGGQQDIKRGIIRCVGDAKKRFSEDGLRSLRALRFAAQLGFTLARSTLAAIPLSLGKAALVSQERVREELEKTVLSPSPLAAFRIMEETGLLALILPELAACRGVEQRGFHRFDVLDHILLALEWSARFGYSREVRLAALFHDVGKPGVRKYNTEKECWSFYDHETESERLTCVIMTRLRWPGALISSVCHLVACHMFHYEEGPGTKWSDGAVRRFVARVGEENLPALYALRRADVSAMANSPAPADLLLPLMNRVETVLAKSRALSVKDLACDGHDLIAAGIPAGPRLGIILRELLDAVLRDPELNTKERLVEIAHRIAAQP